MIKRMFIEWLEQVRKENAILFGMGPLNCAKLGEINKRDCLRR